MHLVSAGLTTVLSDFADLEMKSSYHHKLSETTDFSFYRDSRIFVEVNKKAGLEVMRIKERLNENDLEIQRVRQLKVENAFCVACARQSFDEIALGLSNGQVRVYNYCKKEILNRYNGHKLNSVIFLDYNCSDEYIAAVQEHGLINVYGTKTCAKLETITIDSSSTLVRFHPTKRFQLAIASYRGAVTTYDINSKRKLFHAVDSHTAPCRDLCMSAATPDALISVGYDCVINIFDLRRKGTPIKLKHDHPLSTVALSDCGTFFCVGNLKGELATYDMRSTKTHLSLKKIHDCAVNRVAFVPQSDNGKCGSNSSTSSCAPRTANSTITDTESEPPKSASQSIEVEKNEQKVVEIAETPLTSLRSQRDSFCDFFDIQGNKGIEKTSSRLTHNNRDSFEWEAMTQKSTLRRRTSLLNMGSGCNAVNEDVSPTRSVLSDCLGNKSNNSDSNVKDSNGKSESHVAPLRESNKSSTPLEKLKPIKEVEPLEQTIENTMSTSSGSDKENLRTNVEPQSQVKKSPPPIDKQQLSNESCPLWNEEFRNLIEKLRSDMDERLHQLEYNLKLDAERNKWSIFTQSFDLWQQQMNNSEEIKSALAILLQTDPFVAEFTRLKEENEVLKEQLTRLSTMKK